MSGVSIRRPLIQRDLIASIVAGREWLEQHGATLLPDALVFAYIGIRAAGMSLPKRLRRPRSGSVVRTLIPLSPAFNAVAAGAGRLYHGYRGKPPFADERIALADRATPGRRRQQHTTPLERHTINRALADAVRGRLSAPSLRWMRQRHTTRFVLTHQLLAWLFCVWNGCRDDAPHNARRMARRVFWEARHVSGYYDLLAQQTAFLALGAWPTADLQPLVRRVLRSQDANDGGWHYFERTLSGASEALTRVCYGESPLLGWPIRHREGQLGVLADAVHQAHRGHATALSVCALGVFWRASVKARTSRGSTP